MPVHYPINKIKTILWFCCPFHLWCSLYLLSSAVFLQWIISSLSVATEPIISCNLYYTIKMIFSNNNYCNHQIDVLEICSHLLWDSFLLHSSQIFYFNFHFTINSKFNLERTPIHWSLSNKFWFLDFGNGEQTEMLQEHSYKDHDQPSSTLYPWHLTQLLTHSRHSIKKSIFHLSSKYPRFYSWYSVLHIK